MCHISVKRQSDETGAFSSAKIHQRQLSFIIKSHSEHFKGKRQTSEPRKDRRWYWGTQLLPFHICSILCALQLQAASSWVPASFTVQGEWCCLNPQLFNIYLQGSVCGLAGCTTQPWDPASPDSCSTRGSGDPAPPFACFALVQRRCKCWVLKEVEGKDVCLRYVKILPFWNTIRWEERHLFWEGSSADFVWSGFVLNDMSEKGEGLSCSKESIRVKQSATGISQWLPTFTHFSKSKTALSLTSVWFKLGWSPVVDDTTITSCPPLLSVLTERQSNYSAQLINCRTEQHLQSHVIQTSFYLSWHKCQTLVCPWTGCQQETVAEWVMPVILRSVSQHGLPGKEQVMLGQERKSDVNIYFFSWRGNG